ncbi:MAG: hypothetical protein OEZ06_02265 [Myxococcales bacterium]|nr:hypothetical protein [Myxococcales bacterium]
MSATFRRGRTRWRPGKAGAWLSALSLLLLCCSAQVNDTADPLPPEERDRLRWPDPLEHAPRGEAQRERLCARDGDDPLRDLFCAQEPPSITGIAELQDALGFPEYVIGGFYGMALTGHSTAAAPRSVSALNPRAIVFQLEQLRAVPPMELLAVGFVRGEQTVEFVVRDRVDSELRFYLLKYRQACNDDGDGCGPADLLTPQTEQGWTEFALYGEQDLQNTVVDCLSCHQPDGPGTPKFLRMQELKTPWTHWLFTGTEGGRLLFDDYRAAHGDEDFAGRSGDQVARSHPGGLELVAVYSNFAGAQPNEFDGAAIEAEVALSRQAAVEGERPDDWVMQLSATWRLAYERARRGEAIPAPYPELRVTDPDKLAAMGAAYAAYRAGELLPEDLPDIRDVFPDDPWQRAAMGFGGEPGLPAQELLVQACAQCHNSRLDPKLSRAGFNVELDVLSRAQKDAAIERLRLPGSDIRAMPPVHVRVLDVEQRAVLIELLQQ